MVTFEPEKHEYAIDGVRVPSVTQVLKDCYDFSRVAPDVLQAKAELGTAVHLACELDDAGDLVEESVHAQVRPYLDAYRLFKQHKCTHVVATEQIVHHPLHRYAGKLDLITEFDGARWLVDWKTPLSINPAVGLQTAAYVNALPKGWLGYDGPYKRAALQLKNDGTYKLHEFAEPNDWPVFLAKLTSYRWNERNLK
jgi:hypothetical protein